MGAGRPVEVSLGIAQCWFLRGGKGGPVQVFGGCPVEVSRGAGAV